MSTHGPAYVQSLDGKRVADQLQTIRTFMLDGTWRSLTEIESALGYPQASISSQLRHLRKEKFGGYVVEKRRRTTGTWEYRVCAPVPSGQMALI